jgi:hypothetical protein
MRGIFIVALLGATAHADEPEPPVELEILHAFPGIDIVKSINDARHEHGGSPAPLDHVVINFEVRDTRAHTISVRKVEIVYANCDKKKRAPQDVQALKLLGHALYTWDDVDPIVKGKASVSTPAGKAQRLGVNVNFEGITTYSGCAFAVDIVVDRIRKKIELPLQIKRMEPMRR